MTTAKMPLLIASRNAQFAGVLMQHLPAATDAAWQVEEKIEKNAVLAIVDTDSVSLESLRDAPVERLIVIARGGIAPESRDARVRAIVAKPVSIPSLIATLRAVLGEQKNAAPLEIAPGIRYHAGERKLSDSAGKSEYLTQKEAEFLSRLLARGEVTKEEMLELWGYAEAESTRTLDTHLYRLRGKLKEMGIGEKAIIMRDGNCSWNL